MKRVVGYFLLALILIKGGNEMEKDKELKEIEAIREEYNMEILECLEKKDYDNAKKLIEEMEELKAMEKERAEELEKKANSIGKKVGKVGKKALNVGGRFICGFRKGFEETRDE